MKAPSTRRVLVMGYGNPARQDDGLGPTLVERIETLGIPGVTLDADYQLTVEDAAAVAEHDVVVFVDAAVSGEEPFSFKTLEPKVHEGFSTHSVEPETVLGLARDLFHADSEVYILGIRGYSFEMFTEGLTPEASANLEKAIAFLTPLLHTTTFDAAAQRTDTDRSAIR